MDDNRKIWTTVGSAGTLSQADLAKVTLHQSIIQLGAEILPPVATAGTAAAAAPRLGPIFPSVQAVVRYNVTPVEGLFFIERRFKYGLQIRFRGHVSAQLMETDLATGSETSLILFDSASSPPLGFDVRQAAAKQDSPLLDFINKAYYVEATLTAPALVIGHPAAISIIKLMALPNLSG